MAAISRVWAKRLKRASSISSSPVRVTNRAIHQVRSGWFASQIIDIPSHGFVETLADSVGRSVSEQVLRFADICQGMAHVTGTKVPVDGLEALKMREMRLKQRTYRFEQLI